MATNPNRLAGVTFIKVDGEQYMLRDAAKWSVDDVIRETITGLDGVHGFIEKAGPGWIEVTISDYGDLEVADFMKQDNVTVTLEQANGKMIVLHNAWTVNAREVDAVAASMAVRWESKKGEVIRRG
jgi:hypothetical protein